MENQKLLELKRLLARIKKSPTSWAKGDPNDPSVFVPKCARRLARFGRRARPAIPFLLYYLHHRVRIPATRPSSGLTKTKYDTQVQTACRLAIEAIDIDFALAILKRRLVSQREDIRYHACATLEILGSTADRVIPELSNLLNDPEKTVRCKAALALGAIDPAGSVTALINGLQDGYPLVRQICASIFAIIDPLPMVAIRPLLLALDDESKEVRHYCGIALFQVLRDSSGNPPRWLSSLLDTPSVTEPVPAAHDIELLDAGSAASLQPLISPDPMNQQDEPTPNQDEPLAAIPIAVQKPAVEQVREKLRRAVDKSGKTQEEIGILMGASKNSARKLVSRILSANQDHDPRLSTLLQLADALGRTLSDILSK